MNRRRFVQALASVALLPSLVGCGFETQGLVVPRQAPEDACREVVGASGLWRCRIPGKPPLDCVRVWNAAIWCRELPAPDGES